MIEGHQRGVTVVRRVRNHIFCPLVMCLLHISRALLLPLTFAHNFAILADYGSEYRLSGIDRLQAQSWRRPRATRRQQDTVAAARSTVARPTTRRTIDYWVSTVVLAYGRRVQDTVDR